MKWGFNSWNPKTFGISYWKLSFILFEFSENWRLWIKNHLHGSHGLSVEGTKYIVKQARRAQKQTRKAASLKSKHLVSFRFSQQIWNHRQLQKKIIRKYLILYIVGIYQGGFFELILVTLSQKYSNVLKSTTKYQKIPKNTKKYQKVPKLLLSTKMYKKVPKSTK